MLAMPASLSPFDLICSETNKYFQSAQTVNCPQNHTFSLQPVLQEYGLMLGDRCERPGPCFKCEFQVTSYSPNPDLQNRVNTILKLQASEKEKIKGKTYPFELSFFTLESKVAGYYSLVWSIKCSVANLESKIESFQVKIDRQKELKSCKYFFVIIFQKGIFAGLLLDYFNHHQVKILRQDNQLFLYTNRGCDVHTLINHITAHNEIEKDSEVALRAFLAEVERGIGCR